MLVSDKDALARLHSSSNLVERLRTTSNRRAGAMDLFKSNGNIIRQITTSNNGSNNQPEKLVPSNWNPFGNHIAVVEEKPEIIQEQPRTDDLIDNASNRIRLADAHNEALNVLVSSVKMLGTKLDEVRADKLPSVIAAASKTVESIRREQLELNKERRGQNVHFHFYEPKRKEISEFEVIDV